MRLTETTMAVRPRSNWEALDIGTLLARRHAFVLLAGWASITLPIFVLLSLAFWEQPGVAVLLFWWLKPLFERLPLHVLSQALFGEAPSLRQSLRAWPGLLRHQWLPSLTWRRLSMTRSFDLPVVQLEQLAGRERSRRLATLHRHSARTARWLTLVGVHLEGLLWLGLSALLLLLLPSQALQQLSWQELLLGDHDWLWLEHLSNLLYVLGLIIWEPIYVACGFSLYLNRRTRLEAWDIELSFRRLRQRLLPGLLLAPLAFSLCLAGAPDRALADDSPAAAPRPLVARRASSVRRAVGDCRRGAVLDASGTRGCRAGLEVPPVAARVRLAPTSECCGGRPGTLARPGDRPAESAGRRCRRGRAALGRTPARRRQPALPRLAQPPAARLRPAAACRPYRGRSAAMRTDPRRAGAESLHRHAHPALAAPGLRPPAYRG